LKEMKELWSSVQWRAYFSGNCQGANLLRCETEVRLDSSERRSVIKSLQAFQLGESSEGLHLYRCAEQYAKTSGDPQYLEAIKLFIREEQRHAQYLARFMGLANIPLVRKVFIDDVFRMLRQLMGLECSIAVLITAEIIAKVFYRALRDATHSVFLKAICDQILRDEKMHVQFQAERLAILRKGRRMIPLLVSNFAQRFLFAGTVLVVWMKCRETLRAGHYTFTSFFHDCRQELDLAMSLMDYHTYEDLSTAPIVSQASSVDYQQD
jgi:rubrerythrin